MARHVMTAGERHDAYASRMDAPTLLLAFIFLGVWSITSIDTDMPERYGDFLFYVNGFIWLLLIADLAIRIVLAKSSWRYLLYRPLDVLSIIVPMLRPLKVLTVFSRGGGALSARSAVRTLQAVLVSAAVLVWVCAVTELNFEIAAPGASITSFGRALWWAMTTITTVGYGDIVPVTVGGRFVAAGLMIVGLAIVGLVTAWVAAWFVRLTAAQELEEEEESLAKSTSEIRRLRQQLGRLEAKIDRLMDAPDGEAR